MELVGVEQRERSARQLMADPREAPDREQRISEVGDRTQLANLRPQQHDHKRREAEDEQRELVEPVVESRPFRPCRTARARRAAAVAGFCGKTREGGPSERDEEPGKARRPRHDPVPDDENDRARQVRTPRRAHRDAKAEDSEAEVGVEECEGAGGKQGEDEEVGRQRFSGRCHAVTITTTSGPRPPARPPGGPRTKRRKACRV